LVALAQWCHRFSPSVGIEEGEAPETLLLDATNLAPLYGGEAALVEQAARALRRRGLVARLALGDTVGAAWAAVHFQGVIALPLAALRLPLDVLETLSQLGLACVGDVLALPREQLRSRLGPIVLLRIDQLTGAAPEVFTAVAPPEEFAVEQSFEYPITKSEAIRHTIEKLLERLAWLLSGRRAGALAVECRFACEGAPAVAFEFGLFQPTGRARNLLEIADLQLERLRLPAPAAAIEVRVLRHAPLEERQAALFDEERSLDGSRRLAGLVDRLTGRLGPAAVIRVKLLSDAQPELAYREEMLVGSRRGGRSEKARHGGSSTSRNKLARGGRRGRDRGGQGLQERGALDRPLRLLARPAAVEMASVVPEGPPIYFRFAGVRHDVARHWGPERIETGWWRRQRAVRDYYRVETIEGRRFWLFRRRRDGRWFLHGAYE
jgi:protein ImuB